MFCYPEHIAREMKTLFARLKRERFLRGLSAEDFASRAAGFLATLNAIHPFREGNGRAQTTFLALLAHRAGHPPNMDALDPERFLAAMIASFGGEVSALRSEILQLIA